MMKFISLQCGLIHFFLSHYQESMTTLKIIYEKITALRQVVCTKFEERSCTIKTPIRPVLETLYRYVFIDISLLLFASYYH